MEIPLHDLLLFVAPLGASATTLAAMHWFPGAQQLERTTAYAVGTIATVGIPAATMLLAAALGFARDELFWASLLLVNALVSGATVNLAYWIDSKLPITLDKVASERSN